MINHEPDSGSDPSTLETASDSPEWKTVTVTESEHLERLDAFLVRHFPKFSRVKLQRAIAAKQVRVAGNHAKSSTRLKQEQKVEFCPPQPEPENTIPEDIPLNILFEDEHIVAVNKPPSMVVHPAKGHWSGTLTAALAFHFQQLSSIGGAMRPGIVHRLDRDTSGVILVAKSDIAHINLASQFEKRLVEKEYFAIVSPSPNHDRDIIDKPIGAHPYQREKKAIRIEHSTSRNAISFFEVIERFQGFASVRVKPKTGRTHQIRVHMAHIGCSVLCDRLYSGRAKLRLHDLTRKNQDQLILLERQALHAHHIKFKHPIDGREMLISAPIPDDIEKTEQAIRDFRPVS